MTMKTLEQLALHNRFAALGEAFATPVSPSPLTEPELAVSSPSACALIDLAPAQLQRPEFLQIMAGAQPWPGSQPCATVYAGHQFGGFSPRLGDGRGLLLGEAKGQDGQNWELHLKGAGLTPYSRMGDGRAVLRSSIREFLASEYLSALGIPSTRALAVVATSTAVRRERIERGATLLRLAHSHLRFGHFEYFYYSGQHEQLKQLIDFSLAHYFPEQAAQANPIAALFTEVLERTAKLIAQWQAYGFCHGVMNTDNMSLLGLTLDYGPYAFLDDYDAEHICNHSDLDGRYRFSYQPGIAQWNLSALAQTLTPWLEVEALRETLNSFMPRYQAHYLTLMRQRLGLLGENADDLALIERLLQLMQSSACDFNNLFRHLSEAPSAIAVSQCRDEFVDREAFDRWAQAYLKRLDQHTDTDEERSLRMQQVNPKYLLRNYLAQEAISAAEAGDFAPLQALHQVLTQPFTEQLGKQHYAQRPPDWGKRLEISCSS